MLINKKEKRMHDYANFFKQQRNLENLKKRTYKLFNEFHIMYASETVAWKRVAEIIGDNKISQSDFNKNWEELYEKFFGVIPSYRNPEFSMAMNKNKSRRRFIHKPHHFFDKGRMVEKINKKYNQYEQLEEPRT